MSGTVRVSRALRSLLCLAVLGGVLAGCGSGSANDDASGGLTDADRGFVGAVDGTDAFVAILAGGAEAVAYVCDGDADIGEWFKGTIDGSVIALTNDSGAQIEATLTESMYVGTVTLADGNRRSFTAERAVAGSGLLRVTGPEADADGVTAGWIVDNEGRQRGSLRLRGVARTAPPVPTASVAVDGTDYPVSVFLVASPGPPAPGVPVPYPNIGQVAVKGR